MVSRVQPGSSLGPSSPASSSFLNIASRPCVRSPLTRASSAARTTSSTRMSLAFRTLAFVCCRPTTGKTRVGVHSRGRLRVPDGPSWAQRSRTAAIDARRSRWPRRSSRCLRERPPRRQGSASSRPESVQAVISRATHCDRATAGESSTTRNLECNIARSNSSQNSGLAARLVSSRNTRRARIRQIGLANRCSPRWIARAASTSSWSYDRKASYDLAAPASGPRPPTARG